MTSIVKLFFASLICSLPLVANEAITIKLTPPLIKSETLSEKIVCTRPMRVGKFNISLEKLRDKTIINCYGHGGSGWTALFGSVNKAIELFEKTLPTKETPIHVIGSGCMGLTTAIELTRLGYKVNRITTKNLYDIPSWKAAGYFALVSLKTSPEEEEALNQIGLNTFLTYQLIEKGAHPYITKETVKFMPVYSSIDTEAGVEDLEKRGLIPPREYVTLDFGGGVIHSNYVKYMTYFINTTNLMQQLTQEVDKLCICTEVKEINAFNDIEESIIFNCAGLGGKELNDDELIIPVRGHLVTLNDASGNEHMDYMIYTKIKQLGEDAYIYLFPKSISVSSEHIKGIPCMGVLGGTFIPNANNLPLSEQETLDNVEFKKLLDRTSEFFLGHSFDY